MGLRARQVTGPLPGAARAVLATLFAGQLVLLDLATRGLHPYAHPRAWAGAAGSVALWWLIASLRGRRGARAGIAAFVASLVVVEAFVFGYYHVPIDRDVIASAAHGWRDVWPVVRRVLPAALAVAAALAGVEYLWLGLRVEGRPHRRAAAVVLGASLLLASPRDGTPELRLLDAVAAANGPAEAAAAASIRLPPLLSTRETLPNIVLVLTESVRADDDCSAPRATCPTSPELNALFPDRFPLTEMRSLASYTAVSVSALLTGRAQAAPRAEIVRAPTLFDYARAVRARGTGLTVAYWSAQSSSLFERGDIPQTVDSFVTLETLLGQAVDDEDNFVDRGVDRLLSAYAVREMPKLREPFLLVLHYAATHAPYFVDEARAPFQPWRRTPSWSGLEALHNAQRDAILAQDASIAAALRAFLEGHGGAPYLVFFTSDHGEAFGEHSAIHHGQSLYDEQIHVPAWIAAGHGALDEAEASALRARQGAFVTHLDLLPTVLDAWGVLDGFALASARERLPGRSLLSPLSPDPAPPLPITNCTDMFPCPVRTWGMLEGDRAIVAQPWDGAWNCVDLASGRERLGGEDARCTRLRDDSRRVFPLLPNGEPNQ